MRTLPSQRRLYSPWRTVMARHQPEDRQGDPEEVEDPSDTPSDARCAGTRRSLPTARRRTGQVFGRRPVEREVGAGWSAPLDDRWGDLPSAGSSALHRGHRAGVVPALARVLLVRRITRVLATVVAAELLARLDLASAPHVRAVHPTSSPAPRRWTSPIGPTLYASRALCQPLRVHPVGSLVCSRAPSEPTGEPPAASARGSGLRRRGRAPGLRTPTARGAATGRIRQGRRKVVASGTNPLNPST